MGSAQGTRFVIARALCARGNLGETLAVRTGHR